MAEDGGVDATQESMTYRVGYGPAHLAELEIDVDCDADGVVTASLVADSQGMANRVHPFRVRLDTQASSQGASHAQTWIREKGQVRRYRSQFNGADGPRVATESVVLDQTSREIVSLPDRGHDLLSWMLHLRRRIAEDGRLSESIRYPVWDGWKLVWLDVTPGEVESMETSQGSFDVQVFELQRTHLHHEGEQLFETKNRAESLGTIWFEVGSRALPVRMTFEAPIGKVRIDIADYERTDCEQ